MKDARDQGLIRQTFVQGALLEENQILLRNADIYSFALAERGECVTAISSLFFLEIWDGPPLPFLDGFYDRLFLTIKLHGISPLYNFFIFRPGMTMKINNLKKLKDIERKSAGT
jgi:hypothetical protein